VALEDLQLAWALLELQGKAARVELVTLRVVVAVTAVVVVVVVKIP
jgi:hypothetical protein